MPDLTHLTHLTRCFVIRNVVGALRCLNQHWSHGMLRKFWETLLLRIRGADVKSPLAQQVHKPGQQMKHLEKSSARLPKQRPASQKSPQLQSMPSPQTECSSEVGDWSFRFATAPKDQAMFACSSGSSFEQRRHIASATYRSMIQVAKRISRGAVPKRESDFEHGECGGGSTIRGRYNYFPSTMSNTTAPPPSCTSPRLRKIRKPRRKCCACQAERCLARQDARRATRRASQGHNDAERVCRKQNPPCGHRFARRHSESTKTSPWGDFHLLGHRNPTVQALALGHIAEAKAALTSQARNLPQPSKNPAINEVDIMIIIRRPSPVCRWGQAATCCGLSSQTRHAAASEVKN